MRRALLSLAAFLLLSLSALPVQATPGTPMCPVYVQPGGSTPAVIDPEMCEQVTGRIFPEAIARPEYLQADQSGHANTGFALDTVSWPEFEAGLRLLESRHPDLVTVHEVAQSVGWDNAATGARDTFPVYMVELTNKQSPVPVAERQALLFMLSIHGLEQGGREGGFRVLEDLLKGIGMGGETVQDGAGLPTPIARPGADGDVVTYQHYLDFMRVFLLFPNPDGWVHEEADYVSNRPDGPATCILHCRGNGHAVDPNRQAPTLGWQNPNRNPVGEPEAIGYYEWMLQQGIDWAYAIDIHGMGQHQNFVAIMLPAASMTPQEMQRTFRLAETLNSRLNTDPHFDGWRNAFAAGEAATGPVPTGQVCVPDNPTGPDCPLPGSALSAAGSSTFAEYYTVIDAIGYTDSGFNGDYFAQDSGLDAPGYDLELAYSVGEAYAYYALINDYHVKTVREIVKSFMDAAALDVRISFETHGRRTLVVEPSFVATSLDDLDANGQPMTPGGWADENPGDDLWDYGKNGGFTARPSRYWHDLKPFLRDGDQPGTLVLRPADAVAGEDLASFDTIVVPGSAVRDLEGAGPATIAALRAWTEAGGELVLTDEALRFFDLSGLTSGAVDVALRYMGGIKMDLAHPLFYPSQDATQPRNVRGGVKQTYEPTPIGFETGANAAPNWFIDPAKYAALKGTVAGLECGTSQLTDACAENGVALGSVPVGSGRIHFIGALLPDPTEEFYHPYGLDSYATTYSGNQILRNMLLWTETFEAPPVVITDAGEVVDSENEPTAPAEGPVEAEPEGKDSPGVGLGAVLAILAVLVVGLRRRR